MAASLELHDQILRTAIEANQGYVFSTAGDAFAAAFPTAEGALAAAVRTQLELLAADWPGPPIRVRMGIHTGSADERDGDYFGPVLNRAARIMSAGNGGQLLVSSLTAELVADGVPEPGRLVDIGIHHLKDLERPEQLFEFRHPELPEVTDPLKTVDIRSTNLPEQLTSFIGRAKELREIGELLSETRLVTLTGVGGTGKTRLSQEAALASAEAFDDGVWLAELAPVTDPSLVMSEIAEIWGLRAGEGADLETVVHGHLSSKNLLLIVDNCEHVLDATSHLIDELLRAAPGVRVIATSRESLGVQGEIVFHVPSLVVAKDAGHAMDSEAVKLFLDRAHTARPDFAPGDDDIAAIVKICQRIDGIPLGVELAAARLRSMDPPQLAERLEDSFRILGSKSALPRHRTLNTTIEWSHDLLKPGSRAVFRRLSVFAGGFDLLAAEAVGPDDEIDDWEILDLLDDLVDKSLVIADHEPGGTTRFRVLEPIRQFGAERLAEAGEESSIKSAHAGYFIDVCRRAEPGLRGPGQLEWYDRIDADYDNIRAALAWVLEVGDLDSYLDACWGLSYYWQRHGLHLEGIDFLLGGLESRHDTDPLRRIKGWHEATFLALDITMPVSVEYGRKTVELAEEFGEPHSLARAKLILGGAIKNTTYDEDEGNEWIMAGDALIREHPEPSWWADDPVWDQANLALLRGAFYPYDHPDRQAYFQQSIDGCAAAGDAAGVARAQIVSQFLSGLVDDDWIFDNLTSSGRDIATRPASGRSWAMRCGGGRDTSPNGVAARKPEMPCSKLRSYSARSATPPVRPAPRSPPPGRPSSWVWSMRVGPTWCGRPAGSSASSTTTTSTASSTGPRPMQSNAEDYDLAGRLLGRADSHSYGGPRQEELASYRETLDSILGDALEALVEEGRRDDRRRGGVSLSRMGGPVAQPLEYRRRSTGSSRSSSGSCQKTSSTNPTTASTTTRPAPRAAAPTHNRNIGLNRRADPTTAPTTDPNSDRKSRSFHSDLSSEPSDFKPGLDASPATSPPSSDPPSLSNPERSSSADSDRETVPRNSRPNTTSTSPGTIKAPSTTRKKTNRPTESNAHRPNRVIHATGAASSASLPTAPERRAMPSASD